MNNITKASSFSDLVRDRSSCIGYLDRCKYVTLTDIIYWIDYDYKNEFVLIPKWYVFDFNSSPCITQCLVAKDEFCIALIHDYLYSRKGKIIILNRLNLSPRMQEYMKASGQDLFDDILNLEESIEFIYNRKFADTLWRIGAIEEAKEIEHRDARKQAWIGYIGIRLLWNRHFKKL